MPNAVAVQAVLSLDIPLDVAAAGAERDHVLAVNAHVLFSRALGRLNPAGQPYRPGRGIRPAVR
jgi:hypothetical protein